MKSVFKFFLSNSKLTFVLTLAVLIYGLMGFKNLRRESRPSVDFARVIISTIFPGASTDEVEEQVTLKIEEQIRSVDGLLDSRSTSAPGLSFFSIRLDIDNTDTKNTVDEIQRALSRVKNLPSELLELPFLKHIKAKDIPLLRLIILGENKNRARDRLAFQIKTLLEKDRGISEIQMGGYHNREFKIILKSEQLIQNHVSAREVIQAVRNHTKNFSAGAIRGSSKVKQVRFLSKTNQIEVIENIVVRSNFSGKKILIKDLGQVLDSSEELKTLARFNGRPMTYLLIMKKEKTDSIELSDRIEKTMLSYPLPKGYSYKIYDNEAQITKDRLSNVINNAWIGFLLVLIILLVLLPGKLGFLSAMSLPVSILGTLALCSSFGITFNGITMLAFIICIGMLVDNAVVVSENFSRLREEKLNSFSASLQSTLQLYQPISATVLTTISAFLPMLVVKGIMGQFIMWIPIVVCVALTMSLFDAFFLLPSRLKFTSSQGTVKKTKIQEHFNFLMENFEKWVTRLLKKRYLVFSSLTGLILFSISVNFWGNKFILFPKDDVREYVIKFELDEGAALAKTDNLSKNLALKIIETAGEAHIEGLLSQAGGSAFGFSGGDAAESKGDMILTLKENSSYRKQPKKLLKKLRNIEKKPFKTLQFEAMRGGPPVGSAVHVVFNSNNRSLLEQTTAEFKKELSQIEGVIDIEDDQTATGPEYRIYPNTERLAKLKLSPADLGMVLQTALQGAIAGELVEHGESFYIRVYYDENVKSKIDSLKQTKVLAPAGGQLVPLEKLVDIKESPFGPTVKKRFDFQSSIEVMAKVNSSKITSTTANSRAETIIQNLIKDRPEISYLFIGEQRHTKESMQSLFQAMILALFGIFIILLMLFKGFLLSILSLSSIALGLVGVSFSFALHQKPLSFLALIGVVGLAGVTINSAIILVSFIENLRKENPSRPLHQTLALSSRYRFKPIVITTFTTVFGLLPSAYSIGGHDSLLIPVTLAFTWGLLSGSLLTLIWIPCGYAIIEDIKQKLKSFFKPKNKLI